MKTKIGIVGGGPSGIFCALSLLELLKCDFEIDIFEKNTPLKTLLPTGGGRCNLSNNIYDIKELAGNYPRGEKFLYSIFSKFDVQTTLDFFKKIGVETYIQEDNRIFPTSNNARDVRDKMLDVLKKSKRVRFINKFIKDKKELEQYDKIIITTGSKTNNNFASQFGHTINEIKPALCGYVTKEKFPPGVCIGYGDSAILFTHEGVSGPYIYKHSSVYAYDKFPRTLNIKLYDTDKVREEIKLNPKKSFGNIISAFIPKSLAKIVVKDFDIQACQVKKETIEQLSILKIEALKVDHKGEVVNAGGVKLSEVDNFCKSKIDNKLYFCGEILDIDGFCGGFNLQNCWSSAYCAALDIAKSINL